MDKRVSENETVHNLTRSAGCSDPVSQPTQLLQHALSPAPEDREHNRVSDLASPKDDGDFSLDSRIIPARSATPRYHLRVSLLQSPGSGERVLVEDSQRGKRQKNGEQVGTPPASGSSVDVDAQVSGSEFFHLPGGSPISASVGKAITTRSTSFHSPPSTFPVRPLSRPTKSMPVGNKHYRRSPSVPSQDSFGGPVSQDPAEKYLASARQFYVPLSDLGEMPTQEAIHPPTDPGMTLPDASEHREFLEAAMRKYEAQRANRLTSNGHPHILVGATPSNSGESSGTPQHKDDDSSFHIGQESRFEFNGSSSFDKMLDRGLADAPDLTPPSQVSKTGPPLADTFIDAEDSAEEDTPTTSLRSSEERFPSPPFEWIAPAPSAVVASSNPRSLLRMVDPNNHYRIAKMRNLAGNVEPRSCVATGAETQPSHTEENQSLRADGLPHSDALPPTQPTPRQTRMASIPPTESQLQRGDEDDELGDTLDIIPDSEPLRAGTSAQIPDHHRSLKQSPLKEYFQSVSPLSEHGPGDLVPDSLEVEESEADIPLAVEVASKNMRGSPAEKAAVHDRRMGALTSAVATKPPTLALDKQPQRLASPPMAGKNSKLKPLKTESTEIPTSLPEQDLLSQAFLSKKPHTAAKHILPSKKRRNGPEPSEPSRASPSRMMSLPPTKSASGTKRPCKSSTESSGDATGQRTADEAMHPTVKEREETGHANVHGADPSPPPPSPPLKPDTSRKKRRRVDDVNRAHEMMKASTSTRNKQSETPAVTTRSAKRLRSEKSSTRGLTAEPATRVFALWKQDGHYYPGTIYSRGLKNKYSIRFDDGTEDEVELKNMRRRELLVGDRVIIIQDNVKAVVRDVSRAASHGSFTLEADNGRAVIVHDVKFSDIRVANRTIQSQWKKRQVVAENLVTVVGQKARIDATQSAHSIASTMAGKAQQELVKTGFVVTINPKNTEPIQTKDEAMRAIREHGGLVIEDWSSVFTMEGKHSQSNKRWSATSRDFRWKSDVNLDRVFLLSDDAHQKPKFLMALALGIPCLSFEWLTREKFSSDWQPFLLPAGYSDKLGARISQLVDLDWGNCTEHLTDIMDSEVPIKLFSQKTVLCVGADLVPLPSNRKNVEEASRCVPWIILCMGATKVEAITDTKQVSSAYMEAFDYIIVKERDVLGSLKLDNDVVVGDVNWVKECLVSSRLSLPKLD